jgi:hypothetical protein
MGQMAPSLATLPHDIKASICAHILQSQSEDGPSAARKCLSTLRLVSRDWSLAPIPGLFHQLSFSVLHFNDLKALHTMSGLEHLAPHVKSLVLQIPLKRSTASGTELRTAGPEDVLLRRIFDPKWSWDEFWEALSSHIEEAAATVSEASRLFLDTPALSSLPVLSDLIRRVTSRLRILSTLHIEALQAEDNQMNMEYLMTRNSRARREIGKAIWHGYARSSATIDSLVMADIDLLESSTSAQLDQIGQAKVSALRNLHVHDALESFGAGTVESLRSRYSYHRSGQDSASDNLQTRNKDGLTIILRSIIQEDNNSNLRDFMLTAYIIWSPTGLATLLGAARQLVKVSIGQAHIGAPGLWALTDNIRRLCNLRQFHIVGGGSWSTDDAEADFRWYVQDTPDPRPGPSGDSIQHHQFEDWACNRSDVSPRSMLDAGCPRLMIWNCPSLIK